MQSSLGYFFNKIGSGFEYGRLRDAKKLNKVGVYKYECLDTKKKPLLESKPKKRVRFESSKALVEKDANNFGGGGVDEKTGIKVKILMTKEEAARLLSKCKDGGVLEFEDVARELVQVPINRVSFVSSSSNIRWSSDCSIQNIKDEEN